MGSFFKKVKGWFGSEEIKPPIVSTEPPSPSDFKKRYFDTLINTSSIAKLFTNDRIPFGALPIYDLEGGDKEIITIENGKPKYIKSDWNRITIQLQEYITEDDIMACFFMACKHAQKLDNMYVNDYRMTGGWAAVTGNKIENRLHQNIYVKDFPHTLLLPEPANLGIFCQGTTQDAVDGMGFFMILEKVRVV